MADPVSISAGIGMASSLGGSLLSAFGASSAGQAQSQAYQYQAGIARMNAQIDRQNADWERGTGEIESQQSGMKTKAQIASTKAIQGGSGLDVNSGSATKVRESELEIGQQNEATIRANAAHKAYGFEVKAVNEVAQANLDDAAADNAKSAGDINAFASILGGVSSVSSKWMQGKSVGIFS